MSDSASRSKKGGFNKTALDALRLGSVLLAVYWCFRILAPFIPLVLWGAIIAVAIYPLHRKLAARLGNRTKLSATLITLLGLAILTTPVVVLTESLVTSSMGLAADISEGSMHLPPPPESVQEWPLVGETLHSNWLLASENLGADGQSTALLVVESEPTTGRQLAPEDTIFLFEVPDDGLLLAVDPTGDGKE